jgi:hypothetical protein
MASPAEPTPTPFYNFTQDFIGHQAQLRIVTVGLDTGLHVMEVASQLAVALLNTGYAVPEHVRSGCGCLYCELVRSVWLLVPERFGKDGMPL